MQPGDQFAVLSDEPVQSETGLYLQKDGQVVGLSKSDLVSMTVSKLIDIMPEGAYAIMGLQSLHVTFRFRDMQHHLQVLSGELPVMEYHLAPVEAPTNTQFTFRYDDENVKEWGYRFAWTRNAQ